MENFYKVVFGLYDGNKKDNYYISTSISALIYWLGYDGADIGSIIEIKRLSRLPKAIKAIKAI